MNEKEAQDIFNRDYQHADGAVDIGLYTYDEYADKCASIVYELSCSTQFAINEVSQLITNSFKAECEKIYQKALGVVHG